jgi:hypothetical protein
MEMWEYLNSVLSLSVQISKSSPLGTRAELRLCGDQGNYQVGIGTLDYPVKVTKSAVKLHPSIQEWCLKSTNLLICPRNLTSSGFRWSNS